MFRSLLPRSRHQGRRTRTLRLEPLENRQMLAAGDLDMTFGMNGIASVRLNGAVHDIAVQPDGKIVVAGSGGAVNTDDFLVARFHSDGTLDTTFGNEGRVLTDFSGFEDRANAVAFTSQGKVIVGGFAVPPPFQTSQDFALAQYNPDGTLDTSFGNNGIVTTDFDSTRGFGSLVGRGDVVNDLAIQADGKILAVGSAGDVTPGANFAIARYNPDGTLDASFGDEGILATDFFGKIDIATSVSLQSDGRIVVGGFVSFVDSQAGARSIPGLARYNADGTLDSTFGVGGKVTTNLAFDEGFNDIKVLSDNSIIGLFASRFSLRKYLSDGSLDHGFGEGDGGAGVSFGFNENPGRIAVQQDGGILIGGRFGRDGHADGSSLALARFKTDGSLDHTFGSGGTVTTPLTTDLDRSTGGALAIQSDGKILLTGGQSFDHLANFFALARYEGDSLNATVNLTAHRPHTEPFNWTTHEVAESDEDTSGAGIRINGDDDNENGQADRLETNVPGENDLILVTLDVTAPDPAFQFILSRSGSAIQAWDSETKGTPLFGLNNTASLTIAAGTMDVWVEWQDTAHGAEALTLAAIDPATGSLLASDLVLFYTFRSIVVVFGGLFQSPSDPADGNHGTFQTAIDLYNRGYDVYMYNWDDTDLAIDEIKDAVRMRRVTDLAMIGYSYGGGSVYDVAASRALRLRESGERLRRDRIRESRRGGFSLSFTAYIDGIAQVSPGTPLIRVPRRSGYHVNYYQDNTFPQGGYIRRADENIDVTDKWDENLDHDSTDPRPDIDDSLDLREDLISRLIARVQP